MKKILVFTGGGLAPALNATLYGVITSAKKNGWEVWGGLFGWASLLPGGKQINLTNVDIEPIREHGGTFLRSSRTNPLAQENVVEIIKKKIAELEIDAIVAIGGDDTLGAAKKLAEAGLPIIGIPKTIDNDLPGTYFTPGFPSAAHYLADFTRQIKEDAAYSLSRIFVIESLGMKAGWLAASAIYGGADVIIPPEWEFDIDKILDLIKKRYQENGNYAVVVISQEAKFKQSIFVKNDLQTDEFGHTRQEYIALGLRQHITEKLGINTKALYPGNYLESDQPIAIDRDLAIALGEKALKLIENKEYGEMVCITRPDEKVNNLGVGTISLQEIVRNQKIKTLPEEYFDKETMLPTQKFLDYMEPILGKYTTKDDEYTRLTKQINS